MDTRDLNEGSYGVASTGACLVNKLQRPFVLVFKGSEAVQLMNNRRSRNIEQLLQRAIGG